MPSSDFIPLRELLLSGRSGSHVVAFCGGVAKTWDDLRFEVSAWQAVFSERKPSRVALFHSDGFEFVAALWAAWCSGLEVTLPGDALLLTCRELAGQVDGFIGEFPDDCGKPKFSKGEASKVPFAPTAAYRSQALNLFTSGSTGQKEKFAKSFAQLDAELLVLESTFGTRLEQAAVASTVSCQHIYGLLFQILWPLCAGRPFVSRTLFFPEEMIAAARRRPLALVSSPAHLRRLPEQLEWHSVRSAWRAIFSSGGPLGWDACQLSMKVFDQAPQEIYGSTETGGVAWRERTSEAASWKLFSDVEVRVDHHRQRLSVRSPKLPHDGWFLTSDRAALDEDRGLTLLGRQDRIVKMEGKRLSLDTIESAILGTGLVLDAKVLVLPSMRDTLGGVVRLAPDGQMLDKKALEERLKDAVAARVERVGVPRRFRVVDAFPLNAQGKTSHADLLALFETGFEARSEKRDVPIKTPQILKRPEPVAGKVSIHMRLPESLHYFKGHFPQIPLLAGVVQIDWAMRYAREFLELTGDFRGMEAVKFQKVLQPGNEVELRLDYTPEKGRLKFEYQSGRGTHSRGVLLFGHTHV